MDPDVVIVATGADPVVMPQLPGGSSMPTFSAADVLSDAKLPEGLIVIADARGDWVAPGVAEALARAGRAVTLAVNGVTPAEAVQNYIRDHALGVLAQLRVDVRQHLQLFGADDDSVYFRRMTTNQSVVIEDVAALVLSFPAVSCVGLADELRDQAFEVIEIGDCVSPRTAEEAVLEGLTCGAAL
jgi:pyruvate/2-oxoglutarate dehydrogenase complex dihydrolipoamide dehydrogenase (E3) component